MSDVMDLLEKKVAETKSKAKMRPWSEFGLTDRMMDWFGDKIARCAGSWYLWNGKFWERVEDDNVMFSVWEEMLALVLKHEAPLYSDEPTDGKKTSMRADFEEWIGSSSKYGIGRVILNGAGGRKQIHMRTEDFNPDRNLLNCANGVVDLRTGEIEPHHPKFKMTLFTGTEYNPNAKAPKFGAFLKQVQKSAEIRSYLCRLFGYGLTGETGEQVFHVHKGTGGNGKGVMITCINGVMGTYAQTLEKSVVLDSRNKNSGGPSSGLARMAGARLVTFSELNVGERFDEAKVKELSGQDKQVAAYKFKNEFEFHPQAKLHGLTNHMPRFSGGGHSLERRLRIVDWPVEVRKVIKDLGEKLVAEEAEGILAWAVAGAVEWYKNGLQCPEEILLQSKLVLSGGDQFYAWAKEFCDESDAPTDIHDLYETYKQFCEESQINPVPLHVSFPAALIERGLVKDTGKRGGESRRKMYSGLVPRGSEPGSNVRSIKMASVSSATSTARRRRRKTS